MLLYRKKSDIIELKNYVIRGWFCQMNILHMKYAVEIAKCGSINKAAERLMMNQPNLSRAVKELETSIGIKIFEGSAKGIPVTSSSYKKTA